MRQGGWDGGGRGGMERQRERKTTTERERDRGWKDEDQHDVVPQPGKKRNKNRKHELDRLQ